MWKANLGLCRLMVKLRVTKLNNTNESGTAFLEFVIALPFLVTILIGLFDVSFAIKEYFFLTDAISSGATQAMVAPGITASATYYVTGTSSDCVGTNNVNVEGIHERVANLIDLQNRSLSSLCIRSKLEPKTDPNDTDIVFVQAYAHYDGMLPLFHGMTISAQTRVPYLVN